MNNLSNKFKDAKPIDTIERIRDIYKNLGLVPHELNWKNSLSGFYSVSLEIGEGLRTNGKGTTKEFALASAYAESLERIQNLAPFRLTMDFSKDIFEYMGFFYSPDEKCLTIDELLNLNEEWITSKLNKVNYDRDILALWRDVSYEEIPCGFIALPFVNMMTENVSHIPIKMLSKLYMSNGMCAGNTPEEALVQGISEVLERYVNKEILVNNIVPPTISTDDLILSDDIKDMIDEVESSGRYKLIIKDCSLSKGLPVVGIIFIDKIDQSYFIKFGCHPNLSITIERTLTELLQGQDINNMLGLKEFNIFPEIKDDHKNMVNILVNGSGHYPYKFFNDKGSYEKSDMKQFVDIDNKEMLKYMLDVLKGLDLDLYVRDVSFLGFPSYHVVVPGISEVEDIDSIKELKEFTLYNDIKKHIRNDSLDLETVNTLTDFYTENINPHISVAHLLNLNIATPLPWYYVNITLYLAAQNYKNENYLKAYSLLDEYIARASSFKMDSNIPYFKCARDFIGCLAEGLDYFNTTKLLSHFYDINIINCVYKDFIPSENILKNYGSICCWNCDDCSFNINCMSKETIGIYKLLKERYAKSDISQIDLLNLL